MSIDYTRFTDDLVDSRPTDKYNLIFMPIRSYMVQNKIPLNEQRKFMNTINYLIDNHGTKITIPTDVWRNIITYLFVDEESFEKLRLKGGKRTRRRVKKTRK
jgi:hypothetical protein